MSCLRPSLVFGVSWPCHLSFPQQISVSAVVDSCNSNVVSMNNTQIISPGFPDTVGSANGAAACTGSGVARSARQAAATATYTYNLTKATSDVSIK